MDKNGTDLEINVNGITICYDDLGAGVIPVIFIHGFPFNKSSWRPQLDFLKETNRVIAYDIRGFGSSSGNDKNLSMALFADDLISFMDALKIKKAIVCGLSMGGYILLNAVHSYPERFEGIIFSDTQCIADSIEAKEKRYKTIQQIEAAGTKEFAAGFIKNVFSKDSFVERPEIVESINRIVLSTKQETIIAALKALAARDETCSILKEIKVPSLILCGSEDIVTPPAQSEFLSKNIKNSVLHIIEKAGHMSNLEQPDEFNRHLAEFITDLK